MYRIPNSIGILSVGNELVEGTVEDKHGKYIASIFKELGFQTRKICIVPDEVDICRAELDQLINMCTVVVITGGLGPTSDDITRDVLSEITGRPLQFRQEIWQKLQKRFKRASSVPTVNRKQAYVPEGFSVFENENGTAPGLYGIVNETVIAAFPGPPKELKPMVELQFIPYIKTLYNPASRETLNATALLTPESVLEEALGEARRKTAALELRWSTRVESLRIAFTLYNGTGASQEAVFRYLRKRLGESHIREGTIDIAHHTLDVLEKHAKILVSAESCTGGFIGKILTDIPGSSRSFWGSIVTYSNDAKERLLGVTPRTLETYGAVSRETVIEMARGALHTSEANVSVSVSGIAGPEGGSREKPVGTVWICAATEKYNIAREYHLFGSRDLIRRWSTVAALLLVEEVLLSQES